MIELPEDPTHWARAAYVGAALAAAGYLGKLIVRVIQLEARRRRARRTRLFELLALLRASRAVFRTQQDQAKRVIAKVEARVQAEGHGYELRLSQLYPLMTDEERVEHGIVRSATIHGTKPINDAVLHWLQRDRWYRSGAVRTPDGRQLARALFALEVHLLMWRAKYEAWIPQHVEHALVYLADEKKHGPGFPKGIEELVIRVLGEEGVTSREPRCEESMGNSPA